MTAGLRAQHLGGSDSRSPESIGPTLLAASAALAGTLLYWRGAHVVSVALFILLLSAAPFARTLADRLTCGLVGVNALGAVAALTRWGSPTWIIPVGFALLVIPYALRATGRLHGSPIPRVSGPDRAVLVAALVCGGMLVAPWVGASADDLILDLTRGYDNVNHAAYVGNLLRAGYPPWNTGAGDVAMGEDYPLGLHGVIAALVAEDPSNEVGFVNGFAWALAGLCALSVAALGWIGVRVAAGGGPTEAPQSRQSIVAAVGYGLVVCLGASVFAPFEVGHAPFVIACTVGASAAWIALRSLRGKPVQGLVILAAGGVALLAAYPPLLGGLALPALLLLTGPSASMLRWGFLLSALAAGLAVAVWAFRGLLDHLVTATGELSTSMVVSSGGVVATVVLALLVREREVRRAAQAALLAPVGFLGVGAAIAVEASRRGLGPLEAYYAVKLSEGAWIVALPVLVALTVVYARQVTQTSSPEIRTALRAVLVGGTLAIIVLIPIGRYSGTPAPGAHMLLQRLSESARARGEVQVVQAAVLAGASSRDSLVIPEPRGWFHPVSVEVDPSGVWTKPAASASQWGMLLRGIRTYDADSVTACLHGRGDGAAIPCMQDWLDAKPQRRLTLALGDVPSAQAWRSFAARNPERISSVDLP